MSTDADVDGEGEGAHSHDGVRHTHADGHSAHAHDFAVPDLPEAVDIFDTILRDGSQQEGLSLTVDDKLRVAEQLDHLGVTFIEGGWPGANPKDVEFFARAKKELHAPHRHAGGLRLHPPGRCEARDRRRPGQPGGCRRADRLHRGQVVGPSRRRGPAHLSRRGSGHGGDSVRFLREHDLRVFLDAEHFFDGYRRNPRLRPVRLAAAEEAGAEALVLCDTNGGSLPDDVGQAVADVRERTSAQLGIHCHNDAGCAVANSLVAVQAGVTQVQGCINGYGERAGNTDLSAAIPNLSLKLAHPHHPGRPPGAADAGGPPHRRAGEHRAQPAAALRRQLGVRPQGRAARQRGGRAVRTSTSTCSRIWSGTAPGSSCRRWPAAPRWP